MRHPRVRRAGQGSVLRRSMLSSVGLEDGAQPRAGVLHLQGNLAGAGEGERSVDQCDQSVTGQDSGRMVELFAVRADLNRASIAWAKAQSEADSRCSARLEAGHPGFHGGKGLQWMHRTD